MGLDLHDSSAMDMLEMLTGAKSTWLGVLEVGRWMVLNSALHRIITFPSFTSGHPFNMNGPTVSNRSSELSNREVILRFSVIKTSGKYSVIFKMLPLKLCSSSFILQHSSDVGQDAGIQLWQRVGDKRVHGPPYVEIILGI